MKLSEDKVREVLCPFLFANFHVMISEATVTLYLENSSVWFCRPKGVIEVSIGNNPCVSYSWADFESKLNHKILGQSTKGWWGKYAPALKALLSLISSPSPTLEEQVREKLVKGDQFVSANNEFVELQNKVKNEFISITSDTISFHHPGEEYRNETCKFASYKQCNLSSRGESYVEIAALLTPPEPTIESLQKRVEELEAKRDQLLDYTTTLEGKVDKLTARNLELETQLQGCVSENEFNQLKKQNEKFHADINQLVSENEEMFDKLALYQSAFEREYAKNSGPVLNLSEGGLHI